MPFLHQVPLIIFVILITGCVTIRYSYVKNSIDNKYFSAKVFPYVQENKYRPRALILLIINKGLVPFRGVFV